MTTQIDQLAKALLDAPVGYVEQTVSMIIKKPVYLKVVEQEPVSGTKYTRKIVIGHGQFPILRAVVNFDSKNISKTVMTGLLQKEESIGSILRKNNITVQRRLATINFDRSRKKVTREYEILCNGSVLFQISEEIRLDFLRSCKDS